MKFFIAIFLLATIISTGHSLTCISCTSSQKQCDGSAVTCASTEDACTSIYTETKITSFKLTTYAIVRGCGHSSECNSSNNPKSLSNQFMSVDVNTACCKSDNCTPIAPIVSSANAAKNGLVCPTCFQLSAASCVADNTVDCAGNETRCTTYSIGSTTAPLMAMAGCATENMCSNYSGNASSSVSGDMKVVIKCSKATVSPSATTSSAVSPSGVTSVIGHYTSDIANSYPNNISSEVYYSTKVTYTPTAFHSTTREPVTHTSTCQCNGCANAHFGLALIVSCIFSLLKCFL